MLRYFETLPLATWGGRGNTSRKTFQMRFSFYLGFWVGSRTFMVYAECSKLTGMFGVVLLSRGNADLR